MNAAAQRVEYTAEFIAGYFRIEVRRETDTFDDLWTLAKELAPREANPMLSESGLKDMGKALASLLLEQPGVRAVHVTWPPSRRGVLIEVKR